MKETIKDVLWKGAVWTWTRIVAGIGAVAILVVLSVMFTPLNQDMTWGNSAMERITATTTAEFSLEGIDNQSELKERIEVMINKTRARQQKQEAQEELKKLQRKETSLE